ncbi:MAG: VWA domain-containing protein, partial [Acidobacteria bacterium]|nr:VWA domain-containing protein [Acidobacteriota bacterium]
AVPDKPESPAEPAAPPKPAVIDLSITPLTGESKPLLQDKRLVILFFDLSSLQPEDLMRAVTTARQHVTERAMPHDLLALAVYDYSLDLVQDLTNNKEVLLRKLDALVSTETEGTSTEELGDPETSEEVYVPDSVQFNIFNTDQRLAALVTLSELYRDLPERKSLIYFSSGFRTTGSENDSQIRYTVDAANSSNMSVYTMDCRGLMALPPGGAASQGTPGGRSLFSGDAVRRQRSNFAGTQETLNTLAYDTGGTAFQDTNDLSSVFQKVWNDTQIYYVLGYYSSNTKEDGKFRKVRVEVSRPDTRLQHRPGYFASKQFRLMTQSERDRQLEEAFGVDRPFTEVPFILQADYFRKDGNTNLVPLSIQLAGRGLQFEEKGDQRQAQFEFLARVNDSRGGIAGVSRDVVRVRLPAPTADRIQTGQILYTTRFQLRPGDYRMKVLIRDNATGKIGSFERDLPVPSIDDRRFGISSVVLGSRLAETGDGSAGVEHRGPMAMRGMVQGSDPLMIGGQKIVPSIGNVFLSRQNLYVYFHAYGSAQDPQSGRPQIETTLVLIKDQKKVFESKPHVVREWAAGEKGVAAVSLSVPLRSLRPGNYTLQIHVRDAVSDTNLFHRVPLAIE